MGGWEGGRLDLSSSEGWEVGAWEFRYSADTDRFGSVNTLRYGIKVLLRESGGWQSGRVGGLNDGGASFLLSHVNAGSCSQMCPDFACTSAYNASANLLANSSMFQQLIQYYRGLNKYQYHLEVHLRYHLLIFYKEYGTIILVII